MGVVSFKVDLCKNAFETVGGDFELTYCVARAIFGQVVAASRLKAQVFQLCAEPHAFLIASSTSSEISSLVSQRLELTLA